MTVSAKDLAAIIAGTSPRQLTADREAKLMSLGYNQALLDHAKFPITGAGTTLLREEVERAVARLKLQLDIEKEA
jgi:hypothetical protein